MHPDIPRRRWLRACLWLPVLAALLHPASADASLFKGETLDAVANGISWVAIVIAPIIGSTIFGSSTFAPKGNLSQDRGYLTAWKNRSILGEHNNSAPL
jgi:hypothetical protein